MTGRNPDLLSRAHSLAAPRRPDCVMELWVNQELLDRIKRNNLALAQERQGCSGRCHGHAEPDTGLEAEP